jgi:hypothetical protein
MVGLDFVKKMDKNWKNSIIRVHVEQYNESYCPYCDNLNYF